MMDEYDKQPLEVDQLSGAKDAFIRTTQLFSFEHRRASTLQSQQIALNVIGSSMEILTQVPPHPAPIA